MYDPPFYIYMVRVHHTVDAQHIKRIQNSDNGNMRIHSQTYSMYQMSILAGQTSFEHVIPIKVNSFKAICCTFAPQTY